MSAANQGSVLLRGITWDHPRGFDCLVGVESAWRALRPDIQVHWTARSLQDFSVASLAEITEEFDLIVVDHPHIPGAHADGLLHPLDGVGYDDDLALLASQSVGQSHASYAYSGRQYGLAIDAAAQVAVRRPDLLSEPADGWDEVFELADAGRVIWPAKPVDAGATFLTLMANMGHPVASEHGQFIEHETGLRALSTMTRLATAVPDWCLEANPIDVAEALATSDDWLYCPLAFGYSNYGRAGYRRHRLAYSDLPRGVGVGGSCLGGAGIAVSASTRYVDECVRYACWVASCSVQRGAYYRCGGQPGNACAWDDDAVNEDAFDFFRATRQTLEQAWLRPRYASWMPVSTELCHLVHEVICGELSPEQALRQANLSYLQSQDAAQAGTER